MSEPTSYVPSHLIQTGLTPGGQGFVSIWNASAAKTGKLVWNFIPTDNNPEISFASFGSGSEVITVDLNGQISIFDFASKEKKGEICLEAKGEAGAVLDRDQNALFVTALSREDGEKYFYHIDLKTQKIAGKLKLTQYAVSHLLWVLDEQHVLVYFKNGGSFSREEGDGLYKINYRSLLASAKCFSGACFSRFEIPPIAIDPARNIGVRPYFDRTEVTKTPQGYRYAAKIQFFRPDTGRTIRNVVVRQFHPEHVFEDIDPTAALTQLEEPDASDEYRDLRDEFLERVDAVALSPTEDAAWVAFQHGLLRKVSFDGQTLSPLIGHPGSDAFTIEDPYIRTPHDNPISIGSKDGRITFGTPQVSFDPSGLDLSSREELILLKEEQTDVTIDLLEPLAEAFSRIEIEVESLTDAAALTNTLDLLIEKSKALAVFRDGNLWNPSFLCKGKRYTERQFFKYLEGKTGLFPLVERYLANLMESPSVLWESYYTPAGVSAIELLVKADRSYLPLFIRYLGSGLIEGEQEDDRLTHLITAVISIYGWLVQTIDMILTRATYQNNKGLDQLQFLLESGELKLYLKEEKNRRYFRRHPLFKTLADEYFHILLPAENKLYESIVAEKVNDIKKILSGDVDLELKHPEYQCFALELALDVENPAILDLLLFHHQNIKDPELSKLYFCLANRKRNLSPLEKKQVDKIIFDLSQKRGQILSQLSEMGFNELMTYQIGEKQMEKMGELNQELEEINKNLRFARLGLTKEGQPLFFLSHPTETYEELEQSGRDGQSIQNIKSGFHANTIQVDDLDSEKGQHTAVQMLAEKGDSIEQYIQGKYLRFTFQDDQSEMTEETFFEELTLTPEIAALLVQYGRKISTSVDRELWYDEEVQCGMYLFQALVLFDKTYIRDLISYLESKVVNTKEEGEYPNEIIYQLLDQYGWCDELVHLILARSISCMGPSAKAEFRFWFKKGGLKDYLSAEVNLGRFYDLLEEKDVPSEEKDWIKTFLLEQMG